jgi:WD domain, G-beta repeat
MPTLVDALQDRPIIVGPMSERELRQAIQHPARAVGVEIEPGLVDLLLRDLGVALSGDGSGSYEAGRLPFLAYALQATWQQPPSAALTIANYKLTGGIQNAIADAANGVVTGLNEHAKECARAMFLRLVRVGNGTEDVRRRVPRSDLLRSSRDPATTATVLAEFTKQRLLTQQRDTVQDQDTVEITHEALLRGWPLLRQWIDTDRADNLLRQELEETAARWDSGGRDSSLLYRGRRLQDALEREPTVAGYAGVARAFVAASRRAANRSAWLRRTAVAGLVILLVAATIAAVTATRYAVNATRQHHIALSRLLVVQSQDISQDDPATAQRLAAAAYRLAPTEEAYYNMLALLSRPQRAILSESDIGKVFDVAFSPDGRIVATGSADNDARLWDVGAHRQIGTATGHQDTVYAVAFSPDGRMLATASGDKTCLRPYKYVRFGVWYRPAYREAVRHLPS